MALTVPTKEAFGINERDESYGTVFLEVLTIFWNKFNIQNIWLWKLLFQKGQ